MNSRESLLGSLQQDVRLIEISQANAVDGAAMDEKAGRENANVRIDPMKAKTRIVAQSELHESEPNAQIACEPFDQNANTIRPLQAKLPAPDHLKQSHLIRRLEQLDRVQRQLVSILS